jgi:hypothetical protein
VTKTTFDDSSFIVNAMMVSNDNDSIFLTKSFSDNQSYSMLMKIDNASVTYFDKDGGMRIDINGSVSSWCTHNSCSKWKCIVACMGSFTPEAAVITLIGVTYTTVACVACVGACEPVCAACAAPGGQIFILRCAACLDRYCLGCFGVPSGTLGPPGVSQHAIDVYKLITRCNKECKKDPSAYPYLQTCKNGQIWYKCGEGFFEGLGYRDYIQELICFDCEWKSGTSRKICGETEKCVELHGQNTLSMAMMPNILSDAVCVPKGCTVDSECYIAAKCWIGSVG